MAKKYKKVYKKGFTIIEMIVAVAIFSTVMIISAGALLSIIDANRKAQAQQTVLNNLNFALEQLTRNIRLGTTYHCDASATSPVNITSRNDCVAAGGPLFAFEGNGGSSANPNDQVIYRFVNSAIERSIDSGASYIPITAPEISIDGLRFYVEGALTGDIERALTGDSKQPKALISVYGHAGTSTRERVDFNIQSTVSERLLDI